MSQDASGLREKLSDFARESGVDESLFFAMLARSICQPTHLHIFAEHDKAFSENIATKVVRR